MVPFKLFHRLRAIITLSALWLLLTTPACAFVLMDGRNITIEHLTGQGRWTVLEVWSADCSVCHRTIGELQAFTRRMPGTSVYGVSINAPDLAHAQTFIDTYHLNFPNLIGTFDEMDDYLKARAGITLRGTPTLLIYNRRGKLVAVQHGAVSAGQLVDFINRQDKTRP